MSRLQLLDQVDSFSIGYINSARIAVDQVKSLRNGLKRIIAAAQAVLKGIDNAQLIQMIAAEATQALKIASHGFRCVRFLPA